MIGLAAVFRIRIRPDLELSARSEYGSGSTIIIWGTDPDPDLAWNTISYLMMMLIYVKTCIIYQKVQISLI